MSIIELICCWLGLIDLIILSIWLVLKVHDKLWGTIGTSKTIYGFLRKNMKLYDEYLKEHKK